MIFALHVAFSRDEEDTFTHNTVGNHNDTHLGNRPHVEDVTGVAS